MLVGEVPACLTMVVLQSEICQGTGVVCQKLYNFEITNHCRCMTGSANVVVSPIHIAAAIIKEHANCFELMVLCCKMKRRRVFCLRSRVWIYLGET
jgi:hypothetical protein